MTSDQFHDVLAQLDDALLEDVDALRTRRATPHRTVVRRWIAVAACLCLLVGTAVALSGVLTPPLAGAPPASDTATTRHPLPTQKDPGSDGALPPEDGTDEALENNDFPVEESPADDSVWERMRILSWADDGFFAVIPDPCVLRLSDNTVVFVTFYENHPPYVGILIADGAWYNQETNERLSDPDAGIGELGETRVIDGVRYVWYEDILHVEQRLPTAEDFPVGSEVEVEIHRLDDSQSILVIRSTGVEDVTD